MRVGRCVETGAGRGAGGFTGQGRSATEVQYVGFIGGEGPMTRTRKLLVGREERSSPQSPYVTWCLIVTCYNKFSWLRFRLTVEDRGFDSRPGPKWAGTFPFT